MHGLSGSLQRMFKICSSAFSVSHHLLRGLCYLFFLASFLHSFYTISSASIGLIILWTLDFVSILMVKIKHAIILGVGVKYVIIYLCTSFTRTLCTVDMQEIFAKLSAFCWTSQVTQVKNPCASAGNTGDVGFIPELRKKWRRKWHPTPVFLPGKSHGQRSLAGYSPWIHKRVKTWLSMHTCCLLL